MSNKHMNVGINILRPQSVELSLDFMVVAEYIPSPIIPINPSPASIGPSELI